jgi:hypothetical protein
LLEIIAGEKKNRLIDSTAFKETGFKLGNVRINAAPLPLSSPGILAIKVIGRT